MGGTKAAGAGKTASVIPGRAAFLRTGTTVGATGPPRTATSRAAPATSRAGPATSGRPPRLSSPPGATRVKGPQVREPLVLGTGARVTQAAVPVTPVPVMTRRDTATRSTEP